MNLSDKLNLMLRLDALIRRKSTSTPKNLATRLELSERSVYNIINEMKKLGGPIFFCKFNNSYCYAEEVVLSIGYLPKNVFEHQLKRMQSNKDIIT